MADRSLYNESLTLSSLIVDNSTSSNSAGYVAKSTVINPDVVSSLQLVTGNVTLYNNTSTTVPPSINTASNSVNVFTAPNAGLSLTNTSGNSTTLITGSSGLTISDNIYVPAIAVGTGANVCSIQSPAFNTIEIGGANTGIVQAGTVEATTFSVGTGATVCSIQSPAFNTIGFGGANTGVVQAGVVEATTFGVGTGGNVCSIQSPAYNAIGFGGNNSASVSCGAIYFGTIPLTASGTALFWNGVQIA